MLSALNYVIIFQQNRPLNSQNVADALQKFNLKKTAVQKALDSLADSGKISFKEYGKQKIYIARQDQFDIPNNEELAQMKEENAKLQEQLQEKKKAISEIESEIRSLRSNLTLEEIQDKEAKLRKEVFFFFKDFAYCCFWNFVTGEALKYLKLHQVKEMGENLVKLRGGMILVRPEDKKVVEEMYSGKINQWRKRKRMFRDIWDAITENSPKDLKEFKEELGIEYDEDVGVSLQSFSDLLQHGRKRTRGQ